MGEPRADKVAVVDEVRARFDDADAALLTEYRGLDVPAMAELRRALRDGGGEYKIYKNTLVRLAAQDLEVDLNEFLVGPTAIAFVTTKTDGSPGDAAAVAKALRDFAKTNDNLVIKGGMLDNRALTAADIAALADLPSRDVLLAQLAGAFQAPMTKFAGLLSALPRNFAYALQALVEKGGAPGAPEAPAEEAPAETTDEAPATEAPATEASTDADDNPADDDAATTDPEEETS